MPDPQQGLPPIGADVTAFATRPPLPAIGGDVSAWMATVPTPATMPRTEAYHDERAAALAAAEPVRVPAVARGFTDPNSLTVTEPAAPQLNRMVGQLPAPVQENPQGNRVWDLAGGADQVARGATAFAKHIPESIKQSLALTMDPSRPWGNDTQRAAVSDMIEGTFEIAKPAIAGALAVHPVVTGTALAVSIAAAKGAHSAITAMGGTPEEARLAANLAAVLVTGVATNKILELGRKGVTTAAKTARQAGDAAVAAREAAQTIQPEPNVIDIERVRPPPPELGPAGAAGGVAPEPPPVPLGTPPAAPTIDTAAAVRDLAAAAPNSPEARTAVAALQQAGWDLPTITQAVKAAGPPPQAPSSEAQAPSSTPDATVPLPAIGERVPPDMVARLTDTEPAATPAVAEPATPIAPSPQDAAYERILAAGGRDATTLPPIGEPVPTALAAPATPEPEPPTPAWSRVQVRDAYIAANPTDGGFDAIAVQNHGERLGDLIGQLATQPWQQARDYGKGRIADHLADLVNMGAAKRAWDRQGEAYYAPVAATVPTGLHENPPDSWFTDATKVPVPGTTKPAATASAAPILQEPSRAETAPAQTPAGPLPPSGTQERLGAPGGGVQPQGSHPPRAGTRRTLARDRLTAAAAHERETLDTLVTAAKGEGFAGHEPTLRAELADRLAFIKEFDQQFEESGRHPDTLLRAIAKGGGLSIAAESAQKGEIRWLKEFQDTRASKARGARGNLVPDPVRSGYVRGIPGVFRNDGLSLDGMLEYLRQEPRFAHIETINDLVEEIRHAATATPEQDAAERLKAGLGERWWAGIGQALPKPEEGTAPQTDVLDTGEAQPRLPEAGQARQVGKADVTFRAPVQATSEDFTLGPKLTDAQKAAEAKQAEGPSLFEQDLEDLRTKTGEPQFSRREEPAPIFYSALRRAVDLKMPSKASTAHVLTIAKNPQSGVKADELKWSGLEPWLVSQTGFIAKADILAFLDANQLHVEEVLRRNYTEAARTALDERARTHGAERIAGQSLRDVQTLTPDDALKIAVQLAHDYDPARAKQQMRDAAFPRDRFASSHDAVPDASHIYADYDLIDAYARAISEFEGAREAADRVLRLEGPFREPKFGKWTIPGGENYRELLLTLPLKPKALQWAEVAKDELRQELADRLVDAGARRWTTETHREPGRRSQSDITYIPPGLEWPAHGNSEKGRYVLTGPYVQNAHFASLDEAQRAAALPSHYDPAAKALFTGGHFEEPNVLAHIRFDDRTDADGNKVLFLEEVQSDWHQRGRREGYREKPRPELRSELDAARTRLDNVLLTDDALGFDGVGQARHALIVNVTQGPADYATRWDVSPETKEAFEAYLSLFREHNATRNQLSTVPDAPFKTTWPELAMKRMLHYAAEHGYDALAWTTGEQQNTRYDLSTHVDQIQAFHRDDGLFDLMVFPAGQHTYRDITGLTAQTLGDTIGKELAAKVVEQPKQGDIGAGWHTYKGLDLKVGGAGMRGFYDDILPRFLNKYAKPWGTSVGETRVEAGLGVRGHYVVDEADGYYVEGLLPRRGPFASSEEAERALEKLETERAAQTVHAINITPAMRASVLEGQPQFARRRGLFQPGQDIPENLRQQAHDQRSREEQRKRELQRAYDTLPMRTVGSLRVPVYDVGKRMRSNELSDVLQSPGVHRLTQDIVDVTDRVLQALLGRDRPSVEHVGLLLTSDAYGVFFPHPMTTRQRAVILINPFDFLREHPTASPEAVADHVYETIVHEATHWFVKGEGPAFKKAYAENLTRLGVEFNAAARAQLRDAYATAEQPGRVRSDITRALPSYTASRRRPATTRDPLRVPGGYETRPPDDRTRPPGHAPNAGLGRGRAPRTVTHAELQRLADRLGTSVDEQAERAIRAGYTIASDDGTTLQSTILPGGAEFVEQDVLPGLKAAGSTFAQAGAQLRRALAPATVGAGRQAAGSLRAMMAAEAQANAKMERDSLAFQKAFDRLLATKGGQDKAIDWWDAVQTGEPTKILPELKPAYDYMRAELDKERTEVQRFGKLEEFNAFYFPQIWKFPKEEAQWVRRKIAGLMGRRPFEGSKGFLKQRKYPTFREGLDALTPKGVEPISYNPVDHFKIKMREMRRYAVARQAIEDFKALGIWKAYGGTFGVRPEGWTRIDGALGTIYGPPAIEMQEAFDPDLFHGLEELARDLGVTLERKPNIGGQRWGYAVADKAVTTKAAGPEGVLMHEIGHILDERYGLWNRIVRPAPREAHTFTRGKRKGQTVQRAAHQDKATVRARATIKRELRALADLRFEGVKVGPGYQKYVRENEEKIANLVHAFLYAPERAKEIAPNSYWAVFNLAKDHAELKPLLTLQKTRSLKLGVRRHQIDLGGFPEIGYYAMPDDAARIFNNHLSRGLSGRSAIYDAYRWLNNTMVTGELFASGLFHLTFTGIDALASQGGLALQEMVGGIEQRKPKMIARGVGRAATVVGTGALGATAGFAVGGPLGILWASGYPLAAMRFIKGWRAKREWLTKDPAGRFFADHVRQMNEGGFRPTWDQIYDNGAMKNAMRALRSGNYPGALARTIPAMLDAVTRPVMSWWVPAQKTANYLDSAAFELERLANEVAAVEAAERRLASFPATPKARKALPPEAQAEHKALLAERAGSRAVIQHALNRVQASMDNRFGEVVYDNWFWKRWLKDLALIMFRSLGWQAGTYKGVIGGVIQQAVRIAEKVGERRSGGGGGGRGGGPPSGGAVGPVEPGSSAESILAADMAWILALIAVSMLMGGMTHYLSTGERPEGRDWLYPKGPDGKRRQILTYLPRLVSAYLHPVRTAVGISAPLNTILARIFITNERWSGEAIREPDDPWFKQAWDALKFAGEEGYQPFLVQNIKRGQGAMESLMGVAPAAGEWQRSDAENYLHDVAPPIHLTHDQATRLEARRDLRTAIQTGDQAGRQAAIEEGKLSRRSVLQTTRAAHLDALQRAFKPVTLDQAIHAYELATPDERYELRGAFARKYHNLIREMRPEDRGPVAARFAAAMQLPVAGAAREPAAAAR